jgi:hypothetical protein
VKEKKKTKEIISFLVLHQEFPEKISPQQTVE